MLEHLTSRLTIDDSVTHAKNLVDRFSDADLTVLGNWVSDGYLRDKASREPWERRMEAAMDLAMQVQKDKNFPWAGCANVIFPLITIASLQFSSRSYENIIQGTDIVKYRVVGPDPDNRLKEQALRIGRHMSWQVLEEDAAWEEQHDRLLINLGIVGTNFIKTYFSPEENHPVSELVSARDLVVDYWAKSIEKADRKTQVILRSRNEIVERVRRGTWRDVLAAEWFVNVPSAPQTMRDPENRRGQVPPQADQHTPYRTLEQHVNLDLDQDGYQEPYIVTIEEQSRCVLRIVARWEREEDIEWLNGKIAHIRATEYYTKYGFIPAPDGGIYDLGFGILLGPLNEAVNSSIDQLLDAGTLQNLGGGFLGRGVKIRGGAYTFAPGEWKRVDSQGDDLRKNIVPLETPTPSDIMFKLLGLLIEYANRVAGTTDETVGVNPGQNTPAETSRNMFKQGMTVYSGIYKRVWRAMKEEFKKRHQLNAIFLPPRQYFGTSKSWIWQEDYRSNPDLVVPAADPRMVSDEMRMQQAAMLRQSAHEVPGYDVAAVEKNWIQVGLRVDAVDHFYPGPDKTPPLPNPKMQVEQLKLQGKQMDIEHKKWEFIMQLKADRAEIQAKIMNLNAQTVKLLAEAQTDAIRTKLEAIETVTEALGAHQEMLNTSIDMIEKQQKGNEDGNQSGGMGGMAASPGQQGLPGLPAPSPAGINGAMGGSGFPAGNA